jgi:alkyldihydroxyacetonephosphate synthase
MDEIPPTALEELANLLPAGTWTTDAEDRREHGRDAWPLAVKDRPVFDGQGETLPVGVAKPTTTEQVSDVLRWANRHRVPVVPYGAGSGVVGGVVPTRGGISLDLGAFDRVEAVDGENLLVTVGAGMLGVEMEADLAARGFTVGHYPQSLYISSVGGWVAARGSGTFSSRYGNIEDMVVGLEVVLPTGEILRTKAVPRSASGPDIKQLFIGSEGTLGVITHVTSRMWPLPEVRSLRALSFPSFKAGLGAIRTVVQDGVRPAVVRLYDPDEGRPILERFGHDPGRWLLVLAFDGSRRMVELEESITVETALGFGAVDLGSEPAEHWEKHRFDASWLTERVAVPGGIADAIEVSHVWNRLEETYDRMVEAVRPHMQEVYGHVSHVYPQGASLYVICRALEADDDMAERAYHAAWDAAMRACLEVGATISHHHGIGLQRAPWMAAEHGLGMDILDHVKRALDPNGIMNPGKLGLEDYGRQDGTAKRVSDASQET